MASFLDIKFNKQGLLPTIIQDAKSNEILMMAYMNRQSLEKTLETGITHFWSRSRQRLWQKGESSGNIQEVQEMYIDCDKDALLIKVNQKGVACHTGHKSCFYRPIIRDKVDEVRIEGIESKVSDMKNKSLVLQKVYQTIVDRKENPKQGSYTNYLFDKGIDKMLKKVGEESAEVIIAAKNAVEGELVYEIADLLYHLMVVMAEQNISLDKIYDEMERRR
ncbi:MAG: bifunctional phosphoribosyl-AMP cyclohydrolase/phosphoribosyl-ATP diphosphatase HisIE [Clostridiales bacterium]|nr:bifunctional phosphoribosyl-AMP cyclohydrolase/phosphoribosyl-ATP diphosphatase HisIE [Clostridiales bacterium]